MKKVFVAVLMLALFAASSSAEVIATLKKCGDETLEPAKEGFIIKPSDAPAQRMLAKVLDSRVDTSEVILKYYDSLTLMQLALNKGEIDSIYMPEPVGEKMLRTNSDYYIRGYYIMKNPIAVAFGFMKEKSELRDKFSRAIEDMEREGVIGILARDFITGPAAQNPPAVEFENFNDAETITAAVTGDMPPLDYVAADGKPADFNTALLAEIGRRLNVNIKLVNVETGARAVMLKSGRADVVFWFMLFNGYNAKSEDVPEEIITSTPYFGWSKGLLIGKK